MADSDLATVLFGPDPDRLDGWWACEACHLRRPGYPCEHDPQLRCWWIATTRPTAGNP